MPPAQSPSERRRSPRYGVSVRVTFESEHNFYTGLTLDLSHGGLFVATNHLVPVGECVRLRFTLPTAKDPIDALTEVRWVRSSAISGGGGEAGMGLQFLELSIEGREAVHAFLRKRESIFFDAG